MTRWPPGPRGSGSAGREIVTITPTASRVEDLTVLFSPMPSFPLGSGTSPAHDNPGKASMASGLGRLDVAHEV